MSSANGQILDPSWQKSISPGDITAQAKNPQAKIIRGKLRGQGPLIHFYIEEFHSDHPDDDSAGIVRRSLRHSDPASKATRPAAELEVVRHDLSGRLMHLTQCQIKSAETLECVAWTSAYCNRAQSEARKSGLELPTPESIREFARQRGSRLPQLWDRLRQATPDEETLLILAQSDAQPLLDQTAREFEKRQRLTFLIRRPQLGDLKTPPSARQRSPSGNQGQVPEEVKAFTHAMEICDELSRRHGAWSPPSSGYTPLPARPQRHAPTPGTI